MINRKETRKVLYEIKDRDGLITPDVIVEYARDENSPMHSWFDWENSVAAGKWRKHQARLLINTFTIVLGEREVEEFNTIVDMKEGRVAQRGYLDTKTILADPDLRRQLLANCIQELRHWQNKHAEIKEAGAFVNEEEVARAEKSVGV